MGSAERWLLRRIGSIWYEPIQRKEVCQVGSLEWKLGQRSLRWMCLQAFEPMLMR